MSTTIPASWPSPAQGEAQGEPENPLMWVADVHQHEGPYWERTWEQEQMELQEETEDMDHLQIVESDYMAMGGAASRSLLREEDDDDDGDTSDASSIPSCDSRIMRSSAPPWPLTCTKILEVDASPRSGYVRAATTARTCDVIEELKRKTRCLYPIVAVPSSAVRWQDVGHLQASGRRCDIHNVKDARTKVWEFLQGIRLVSLVL